MVTLLTRANRKKRRPVRSGAGDRRAAALRLAGLELLARSDFEDVSIITLTKGAGCSVGAFYYRYSDKNAYLSQLIAATFRGLENDIEKYLSVSEREKTLSTITLSEFLSHIISKLSSRENAGIIRATLKLGATKPEVLRHYEEYREKVSAESENIFKRGSKKKFCTREIREAIQIVFAAINDAALMPDSASMKLGSKKMTETLCEIAARHIGVKPDFTGRVTKSTAIDKNESTGKPNRVKARKAPKNTKAAQRSRGKITLL